MNDPNSKVFGMFVQIFWMSADFVHFRCNFTNSSSVIH